MDNEERFDICNDCKHGGCQRRHKEGGACPCYEPIGECDYPTEPLSARKARNEHEAWQHVRWLDTRVDYWTEDGNLYVRVKGEHFGITLCNPAKVRGMEEGFQMSTELAEKITVYVKFVVQRHDVRTALCDDVKQMYLREFGVCDTSKLTRSPKKVSKAVSKRKEVGHVKKQ